MGTKIKCRWAEDLFRETNSRAAARYCSRYLHELRWGGGGRIPEQHRNNTISKPDAEIPSSIQMKNSSEQTSLGVPN